LTGIKNGVSHFEHVIEGSEFFIIILFGTEINVTIATAFVTFICTSRGLVFWFDFTEALLVEAGHWVATEIDSRARLPVISFLRNCLPLSHFFESFNLGLVVWTSSRTEPHSTWALAALVCLLSTLEWLVVSINE
jgi:hypothetical protein